MNRKIVLLSAIASTALGQQSNPLPQPDKTVIRKEFTSPTDAYRVDSEYKKKFQESDREKKRLAAELEAVRNGITSPRAEAATPASEAQPGTATPSIFDEVKKQIAGSMAGANATGASGQTPAPGGEMPAKVTSTKKPRPKTVKGVGGSSGAGLSRALVFNVSSQPQQTGLPGAVTQNPMDGATTVIPLGSYVKARVLTGVEANVMEPYPQLLQLDHAFVGPNKVRIDLSHCFMIAKSKANLSTERVIGETTEISCVRESGEAVKRPAKGYLVGEDSTLGIAGELISRQGQVFGAAVIASLAKGAGEAVAIANTSKEVVSGGFGAIGTSEKIENKEAFILGRGVTDASAMIAQWYLNYAQNLVPSIAVGSGRDIWIVLLDSVQIPQLSEN